jgi:hypothetical protein
VGELSDEQRGELEARARRHFDRIAATMRALEPQWPEEPPEFEWTRSLKPIVKIGGISYLLEDESGDPVDDRVIEVRPGRTRTIAAGGVVVDEKAMGDPDLADLN